MTGGGEARAPAGEPVDVVKLAELIEDTHLEWLSGRRRLSPAQSNRAGELGDPCTRRLVYPHLEPDAMELHSPGLQAVFDLGNIVEAHTIRELGDMGFEWVQSQRPFFDRARRIAGYIDGGIRVKGHGGPVVVGEIKSMAPQSFAQVRRGLDGLEDMLRARAWYVRRYPTQVAVYLHLSGEDAGVIVLRDKVSWALKVVPVPRARVEGLIAAALARAEEVNAYVDRGELPERIAYDATICGRCPYAGACLPPRTGAGVALIDDAQLVELLRERADLEPGTRRFDALDRQIKAAVRDVAIELVVGGEFSIVNKAGSRKGRPGEPPTEFVRTTIRRLTVTANEPATVEE